MAKDISYKIDVNAQDAISEFKKVGKEAERAGKAIEKGLEVSPDTSKIDKFITNLKEAADEAENVGKAIQSVKKFAPEVDDSDIANVVLSLRKAGTEFDAIELKAKDLGTALKQVDVPQIKNLGTNVKGVKTDLDTMRSSSDQSRSVLANMAGNTAQDLGELGGVVGSVGVGIGQLAEYAVDGNISLQNLGKIAGPLAGLTALSLGVKTINERLNSIVESQKKYDEALADLKDSFIETGDAAETLDEQIRGNVLIEPPKQATTIDRLLDDLPVLGGKLEEQAKLWEDVADPTKSTAAALDAAGISMEDVAAAADEGGNGMRRLRTELLHLKNTGKITEDTFEFLDAQLAAYQETLFGAEAQTEISARVFTRSLDGINTALDKNATVLETQETLWAAVVEDLKDGTLEADNAKDAYNQLQTELQLSNEEMDELANEKVAEALEEDRQAALDLAEAMANLKDTIGEIDADDIGNISGALQAALDLGDVPIDFQLVKENLRDGFDELGTFLEENPVDIDWAKVLDTSQDTGLSSELLGMIAGIRDQFQTGITEAFEIGGAGAAQHFVDSFIPQLAALGMSPAQIYEFLGLSPDGSVEVLLKPLVDAEAKADALAILDSLMGVDPDNPILAYIRLGLQTGDIEPQIGEIAARLLAADALNVPANLEEFTQSDVDAAVAVLEGYGITVPVTVDDEGTIQDFTTAADEATVDRTTQVIVPKSDSLGAMQELIDHVARARTVAFNAKADNAGQINDLLDHLARAREAAIRVLLPNYATVEYDLQFLARDRHSNIILHTIGGSGGNQVGGNQVNPTLTPLLTPTGLTATDEGTVAAPLAVPAPMALSAAPAVAVVGAAAPVTNNFHVAVNAAVIGNRHDVERAVAKAMRGYSRLNGNRN